MKLNKIKHIFNAPAWKCNPPVFLEIRQNINPFEKIQQWGDIKDLLRRYSARDLCKAKRNTRISKRSKPKFQQTY
jgi:hypothetical protein